MKARDAALQSILAAQFPSDWSPVFHEHHPYGRIVFRWPPGIGPGQGTMATGQISLTALRSSPGLVEVHGGGCQVCCNAEDAQAAIDHIIKWINR